MIRPNDSPIIRVLGAKLVIDALPAQVRPIVEQTFGSRTFWRLDHPTDFNGLPAEVIRSQHAGHGDGHAAESRLPVGTSLQSSHVHAGKRVPRFLFVKFVNPLAGRFTERAAQGDQFDVGSNQRSKVERGYDGCAR